jgi:hypothetical protein
MTFAKLKDTINNEESNLLNQVSNLKGKIQTYLNEEEVLNKQCESYKNNS